MENQKTWVNSISITPKPNRFHEVSSDDMICVVSLGPVFKYVIPSFDVLTVELRQIKCFGFNIDGDQESYDFFHS